MPDETPHTNRRHVLCLALLALVLAGCAAGGDGGETTQTGPETTPPGEERMLEVKPIDSGSLGRGETSPRAIVAPSLEALSAEPDLRRISQRAESTIADDGGAYMAVLWGEKNTGGYAVEIESAEVEGDTVRVGLALRSPPEGAIVTQALTYPYAIAEIEALDDLSDREFVLVDGSGRKLGWPVRVVEG